MHCVRLLPPASSLAGWMHDMCARIRLQYNFHINFFLLHLNLNTHKYIIFCCCCCAADCRRSVKWKCVLVCALCALCGMICIVYDFLDAGK